MKMLEKYWSKNFLKRNWALVLIITITMILLGGALYLGENIVLQIHDNLDSNISVLKMLRDNRLFFSQGEDIPYLGGLDRNTAISEFQIYNLLYYILPTFTAYLAGYFIKIGIGVYSCVLLARELLGKEYCEARSLVILVSYAFSLLPVFPTYAFGFVSIPLFLYLIVCIIRYPRKKRFYLAIFLYPILSEFVLFGIFLLGYLVCFTLYSMVKERKIKCNLVIATAFLLIGYLIFEYRLFLNTFIVPFESIRTEFIMNWKSPLECLFSSMQAFISGQYHSEALQKYIVVPVCGAYFLYKNYLHIRNKNSKAYFEEPLFWCVFFIAFNSLVYGFNDFEPLRKVVSILFPPAKELSLARTLWLNPFLWYAAFFLVLWELHKTKINKLVYLIAIGSIFAVLLGGGVYNDITTNIKAVIEQKEEELSFREFYSEELFTKIKEKIKYKGEMSAAYAMHPAILNYNGINTIDGYCSNYSLTYKEKFREAILPALEENESKKTYYDDWGGRAYLFDISQENLYDKKRTMLPDEDKLYVDMEALNALGCNFLFSRVKLTNMDELNLFYMGSYASEESPYTIYVYRLD